MNAEEADIAATRIGYTSSISNEGMPVIEDRIVDIFHTLSGGFDSMMPSVVNSPIPKLTAADSLTLLPINGIPEISTISK